MIRWPQYVDRCYAALLVGSWACCLVAEGLIFRDVETVLVTGPVITVCGAALTIWAGIRRHLWGAVLGGSQVGIALLLFGLVIVFQWGPRAATAPFLWIGMIYVAVAMGLVVLAYRNVAAKYKPWECQRCGYALVGLTGDQCPECGERFDVDKVRVAIPPQLLEITPKSRL